MAHVKYLSFYSILQSSGTKHYNANSLTPVNPLLLLLLAGEANFHPTAHVVSLDGARMRFCVADVNVGPSVKVVQSREGDRTRIGSWKTFVALKMLRRRLEEIMARRWRSPGAALPRRLERWWAIWEASVSGWDRSGPEMSNS